MPTEQEMVGFDDEQDRRSTRVMIIAGCLILPIFIAAGVGAAIDGFRADEDRRRFISQCIEHHDIDRCWTLYRYDRRDLAGPKR